MEIEKVVTAVRPILAQMETDRHSLKKSQQSFYLAAIPAFVVAAIVAFAFFPFGLIGLVLAVILTLVVHEYVVGKPKRRYLAEYKRVVIGEIVRLVDPNLRFVPESGVTESEFVRSELFSTRPDKYHSEDLVVGDHAKTSIRLSEVVAWQEETTTDKDGKVQSRYDEFFRGLILIADFHKHFQGRTFVFPDTAENLFGGFGRAMQKLGGRSRTQLAQMDDAQFEKDFAVYTTDQTEARYILSPSMMRRLVDIRKRLGSQIRIAFKDSSIWLAIPRKRPFLEPSHHVAATNTDQIRRLLEELLPFLDVIDELDLNTRIWTKD